MNPLGIAILALVTMKCITAGTVDFTKLDKVLDEDNTEATVEFFEQNWRIRSGGLDHIFEKRSSDFIINLIEKVEKLRWFALKKFYEKETRKTIEKVLEKVEFSEEDFIHAASCSKLACSPKDFLDLLRRIKTLEGQTKALESGFEGLFDDKRTGCIDPLLNALEDKELLGRSLTDIAIQALFKMAAQKRNEEWVKELYDHHLLTPLAYAPVLFSSVRNDRESPACQWLLTNADKGDFDALDTLGGDYWYALHYDRELDDIIKQAKRFASPAGTRLRDSVERAEKAWLILNEPSDFSIPRVVVNLICSYVGERRNTVVVSQEVEKVSKKVEVVSKKEEGNKKSEREKREETEKGKKNRKKDKKKAKKKARKARKVVERRESSTSSGTQLSTL